MKKKIIPAVLALGLGAGAAFALALNAGSAAYAEEDLTPNFDEDFNSYTVDGDIHEIEAKWTNAYFKGLGDGDASAGSPDKMNIAADPVDSTNKCLYVHTRESGESFFYLTMKDIYVKDFRLTYDFYQKNTGGLMPWAGFSYRKPVDGRYNGVTNVMSVLRCWSDDSFGPQMYRSVDSSFLEINDFNQGATAWNEAQPNFEGAVNTWLHVKIEAIGTHFAFYVNDALLGQADIDKAKANNYGFVSIISCIDEGYFDNIHLENLDEEPYTPEGGGESSATAPTMETTTYTVNEGEDLVVTVDTHGEVISELRQANNAVLPQYYELDGTSLTISKDYLATLGEGRWYFVLTTPGGTVSFTVSIVTESASSEESSVTPTPSSSEGGKTNKGCGGSIVASAIVGGVALLGAGIIAFSRKKHE